MKYFLKLFTVIIFLLFGCVDTRENFEFKQEYYVRFSGEKLDVDEYLVHDIKTEIRDDSIFRTINIVNYDTNLNQIKTQEWVELQVGKTLWRQLIRNNQINYVPHLNAVKIDTCVSHEFEEEISMFSYMHCYLGQENVTVDSVIHKNAYVFFKSRGVGHSVEAKAYYTDDFTLLKEEYTGGYGAYYKIAKLNEAPSRLVEAYLNHDQ